MEFDKKVIPFHPREILVFTLKTIVWAIVKWKLNLEYCKRSANENLLMLLKLDTTTNGCRK